MRNFLKLALLCSFSLINAQISIGKTNTSPHISLEFDDQPNNSKGLILPWVSTVANSPKLYNANTGTGYQGLQGNVVEGTLIFDLSDNKIKYKNGTNSWFDLTGELPIVTDNTSNTITAFNPVDSSIQDDHKEEDNAKTIVGTNPNTEIANGILILSDKDKAMVLPKVSSPHNTIINPAAGMIVYDTTAKQLAVFNGTIWSFWKP